ncbi:MAG: PD40 domain-containing protein [Planctomycetes bacterium]|nr:PD40 domain-containing protein [Planctomycetota bacterium]
MSRSSIFTVLGVGVFAGLLQARQAPERVSVATSGAQGNLDSAFVSGLSADGNVVVFVSAASNLVASDTNGVQDVFVRNRVAATTARVSVSSTGVEGNLASGAGTLSSDGRFAAFSSRATNLVAGDLNGVEDIFVKELSTGVVTLVSRSSLGALGNGHSRSPALSGDGRYVAFASRASNLVAGDSNAVWDVFVHDRVSASTVRVSVDTGGAEGNADSLLPSISAGGGCVTFTSWASNLVAGDGNLVLDVFVHELSTGLTECADVTAAGTPAFYGAQRSFLSADGRCVAFESGSNDLVTGDTNSMPDVFVLDRWSGVTTRVSVDSSGAEANDLCLAGPLSSDGRFVIFTSLASNLVPFDLNAAQDVFVHDRASASTTRISVDALGSDALGVSAAGALSGTGRIAVFSSYAANLVAGDTNGAQDVFAIDRGPIPAAPPTSYCTAGTSSIGCSAVISASAQPSLSAAHACTIGVSGLEGQKSGLVFYGIDNACFTPNPWGSGSSFLCVKAPLQRTPLQNSAGTSGVCDGAFTLDWNAYHAAHLGALGQPWSSGAQVFVQAWYRDPPAPKTTALSDALVLIYEP